MSKKAANMWSCGWQPDVANHRDHLYAAPVVHLARLPTRAGLVIFGQSAWWLEKSLV
jgi:hypothetical protein